MLIASGGGGNPAWDNLANLWVDTTGGTCTRSASHAAYDDAAACATLADAYAAASTTDIVGVRGGNYTNISTGNTISGSTKTVTFRVVVGETASYVHPWLVQTVSNLTMYGPFQINSVAQDELAFVVNGCNSNLEFHDLSGSHFDVNGATDGIRFYGGTWGNYDARSFSSDPVFGGSNSFCVTGDSLVHDILFDGVTFQYVQFVPEAERGGGHPDCLESGGSVDGVIIRNSYFNHCGGTFIGFYTDWGNYTGTMLIENNLFYKIHPDTIYAIQIGWVVPFEFQGDLIFRYNTYDPDEPNTDTGLTPYGPPLMNATQGTENVYGNIFRQGQGNPNTTCSTGTWSYNVWEIGPSCGTNSQVGTAGYVNRGTDYHLGAGALAIGAGKPGTAPTDFPATDFEGTVRTSVPDAGYDER